MALPRMFKSLNTLKILTCAGSAALVLATAPATLAAPQAEAPAATEAREIPLAPDAPARYVVQKGDTLWDISARFLRDPWFWPEIWYVNPQVENPHLIYPGDTLTLVYVDGRPRVMLERTSGVTGSDRLEPRLRTTPLDGAIAAIPYDVLANFMGRPGVLAREQVKNAPYIVRSRNEHLIASAGNDAYVRGLKGAQPDGRYGVFHVGKKLEDPDDGDLLGYEAVFTAAGTLTRAGDPATLRLTESARETLDGDIVLPATVDIGADFVPRAPERKIEGSIIAVVDDAQVIGQYQVIAINRGSRHGLAPGHTLGIWQVGEKVKDPVKGGLGGRVRLPDERVGVFIVFKTWDRMSYGLVMTSTTNIRQGDAIRNP